MMNQDRNKKKRKTFRGKFVSYFNGLILVTDAKSELKNRWSEVSQDQTCCSVYATRITKHIHRKSK